MSEARQLFHVPSIGEIVADRYRVDRLLAKGGMGAIYVAHHIETERPVAVKVLWPQTLASETAVDMFKLEARVAARVRSPHIVEVLDAGMDVNLGLPYLVMELLEGRPFDKLPLPMPGDTVVRYLKQVASALDRAHSYVKSDGTRSPIVHRDLKPDNLFLVEKEGAEPFVKILDFGLAKVLTQTAAHSAEFKGTPLFMAWEQAARKPSSPQTDIWALGLIAFYLLTGAHYWESTRSVEETLAGLFAEILALPLDPPSQRIKAAGIQVTLPLTFDGWFSNCVNRRPESRYATAGQAIRDLQTIMQGGSIGPLGAEAPASALPGSALPGSAPYSAVNAISVPANLSDSHVRSTETPGPAEKTLAAPTMRGSNDGRIVAFGVAALVLACGAGGYALFGAPAPEVAPASAEPPMAETTLPAPPVVVAPTPAKPNVTPDVVTPAPVATATATAQVPPAPPDPVAPGGAKTPKRVPGRQQALVAPPPPPPVGAEKPPSTLYGQRQHAGQAQPGPDPLYGKRVH